MKPTYYDIFAGWCAVATGIVALLSELVIVLVVPRAPEWGAGISAFGLMVIGLLSSAVFTGLFERLRSTGGGFALWGLVLALFSAFGTTIRGGYDLALAIHPAAGAGAVDLPRIFDLSGALSYGVAALALVVFSVLMLVDRRFPRGLAYLGILSAILAFLIYLAELILADPASPLITAPSTLSGFVVVPIWYLWVGIAFWSPAPTPVHRHVVQPASG